MKKTYTVKRNGVLLMEEVRAHTEDDAISQVQDSFFFYNLGQEERTQYMNGDFTADVE